LVAIGPEAELRLGGEGESGKKSHWQGGNSKDPHW
jgi:hypothetical protein